MYNRAAGIEILNYGITRLWNWRGAGGMRQRHGAENPGGDTVRKIWTAIRRGKSGRRCCLKPEKEGKGHEEKSGCSGVRDAGAGYCRVRHDEHFVGGGRGAGNFDCKGGAFDIRLCAGRLFRCGGVGFSLAGKAAEDTADCVDGGDVRRQPAGGVCAKL